jgi:hypothetical protein
VPEAYVLWILGSLFTLLIMVGAGAISFILKEVTEALKEVRLDLRLLGKEVESRIDGLDNRVTSLESEHRLYHK